MFLVQPMAQTYLPTARAVAAALAWRMMGINTGVGYTGMEGEPAGAGATSTQPPQHHAGAGYSMVSLRTALGQAQDPCHMAQVLMAEWMLVFAAAHTQGHTVTLSAWHWPPEKAEAMADVLVLDTVEEASRCLQVAVEEGPGEVPPFVWTPQVMLCFLADWVGAAMPMHASLHGDALAFMDAVEPFMELVPALLPNDDRLQALVRSGALLPQATFLSALTHIFGTHAGHLSTHIVAIDARAEETAEVAIALATCMHDSVPSGFMDPDLDGDTDTATMFVPKQARVPTALAQDLEEGRAVAVLQCAGGAVHPMFSSKVQVPPLLQVVLNGAASTMVRVLPGGHTSVTGRHHLQDLQGLRVAAAALFYTTPEAAVAAVVTAFWERFQDQHWARKHSRAPPTLLLAVPLEGRTLKGPADPKPIHLYYLPSAFAKALELAGPLISFMETFNLKGQRDDEGGDTETGPPVRQRLVLLHHGTPVAILRPASKSRTDKFVVAKAPARTLAPASATPSLMLPAMWCVLLTREDVLAIAVSGTQAAAAFQALFQLRVEGLSRTKFAVATESLGNALCTGALFSTGQGLSLRRGVVMELLFQQEDLHEGQRLVSSLLKAIAFRVCEVTSDPRTLVLDMEDTGGQVDVIGVLDEHTGTIETGGVLGTVSLDSIRAWTEPFLCGLVLAANSVVAAVGLGAPVVREALQRITHMSKPSQVNDEEVATVMQQDKARVRSFLDR